MVETETQLPQESGHWETSSSETSQNPPETPPSNDSTPSGKLCGVCGRPIIRQPGQLGRLPRYHPECKGNAPAGSTGSGKKRGEGLSKAEQEADFLAEKFRASMNKAAVVVGVFDPYDGFAIVVQSRPMSESVRSVLASYDRLRKPLMEGQGGTGIAGLAFCSLAIVLPILAHHGVIPETIGGKPIGKFLESLPAFLKKLNDAAEEAEKQLAVKLEEEQAES